MSKVTVIMPSLNVAQYIRECLGSVVCQTLKDIEIICVDAGSTDGTWEALEEYAQTDSRIKLIRSEKKSYGYQMNLGIEKATGEYIGIVETDDYILPEMYEILYTYAKEHDADFVKSDFDIFTTLPNGERLFLKYPLDAVYDTLFTSQDYLNSVQAVDTFIWNGVYKRAFLQSHHIQFQETPGAAYQDIGFRYQVALTVRRGFFLKRSFYRYRRDNAGSSMYNSKCVLYNWSECQYIMGLAKERGWTSKGQMMLLARDMSQTAYGPYMEMLQWGEAAEGTSEALESFRGLIKDFICQGLLDPLSVPENTWLMVKLFVENPEVFEYYARLKAFAVIELLKIFLTRIAQEQQIVLFGCGQVGTAAYCAIRNSNLQNVVAFCDNDPGKWESVHMGCSVKKPEVAVREFPSAYYLITNRIHQGEIKKQLLAFGILEERIGVYNLSTNLMLCTSISLRSLNQ